MLYYRHTNNNSENANDSDVRGYGCVICFLSFLVFHASSVSYSITDGSRNTTEDTPRNLTVFCRPVQPWGFCHWLAVAEHVLHVLRWGQGVHFRGQAGWSVSHKDHHPEQAVQAQLHRRSPQERVGCFNIWVYCVAGVIFGSTGQSFMFKHTVLWYHRCDPWVNRASFMFKHMVLWYRWCDLWVNRASLMFKHLVLLCLTWAVFIVTCFNMRVVVV